VVQQVLAEESVLKIRVKFTKTGDIKYIGHLDLMRYFQKLNRRAGLDLAYSQGFSPHQIMAFAQPLGVGVSSVGEYVDIEVNSLDWDSATAVERMNAVSVPEVAILQIKALPDNAKNAMASVAGALYEIRFKEGKAPSCDIPSMIADFMSQDSILITKETKTGQHEIDIKPGIFDFKANEDGSYNLFVDASSAGNIKPIQVFEAILGMAGESLKENALAINRIDTYERDEKGNLVSMGDLGEDF